MREIERYEEKSKDLRVKEGSQERMGERERVRKRVIWREVDEKNKSDKEK